MKQPENILKITADHSPTLQSGKFGVTYHSIHGAWNETQHVFIKNGLAALTWQKQSVSIFEPGFGTGLNCIATLMYARQSGMDISYTALEPYPLTENEVTLLKGHWANTLPHNYAGILADMHQLAPGVFHEVVPGFRFCRLPIKVEEYHALTMFDLVYFDAFAPETQPELWTTEIFSKMFELLNDAGILVTYCAKGYVKRNMKSAGFEIESVPGPPGKREMTRATKLLRDGQR